MPLFAALVIVPIAAVVALNGGSTESSPDHGASPTRTATAAPDTAAPMPSTTDTTTTATGGTEVTPGQPSGPAGSIGPPASRTQYDAHDPAVVQAVENELQSDLSADTVTCTPSDATHLSCNTTTGAVGRTIGVALDPTTGDLTIVTSGN